MDFTAKRVAVIGTGASGVQSAPLIAQQAKHLTVFQRTPNFCVPARNGKVDAGLAKSRKTDYDAIWERVRDSQFGFELGFLDKSVLETSPEERGPNSTGGGTPAASASGSATTRTCSSTRRPTTSAPST